MTEPTRLLAEWETRPSVRVRVIGGRSTEAALASAGARSDDAADVVVVGEGALDADAGAAAAGVLGRGGVVLVLAQRPDAAVHYPLAIRLSAVTAFPDTPIVLAFEPVPSEMAGTIVGACDVGAGRLVFCQYQLTERAAQGDEAARALLSDLLQWAAQPRRVMEKALHVKPDGRCVTAYRWTIAAAR